MKKIVSGKVAEGCIGEITQEVIAAAIWKNFGKKVEVLGPAADGRFHFMVDSGSRCEETLTSLRRVFGCTFVNKVTIEICAEVAQKPESDFAESQAA